MRQASHKFSTSTHGKGLYNITREIESWVAQQKITTGLLTVFVPHTSASIVIQENADPDVLRDLKTFFQKLVPDGDANYLHRSEGPDDMPAHIRSALTQSQLSIPVNSGNPSLGTWQGIYLFEHRVQSHKRLIHLHLIGE
ncbi:MAG: secondary thiamine-phosphate synthase enzyme YjbQ [Nitrospinaceae bacterium]|nr:secondary thiamine-phosphate synthase enzyme YjbQ [Nitrospinaceae bacterium]MDP6657801.1 secondary thiamine-phosphate synthase enzyme YjbQ [Nitrospinaceae bacterium]MDP6711979.1 secondary thiamine-phosphate synthase enzyme YjbQ [Nitrospinaceae bacterium]